LQVADDALGLGQSRLHAGPVLGEHGGGGGRVAVRQDAGDGGQRDVEVPEAADDLGVGQLRRGVAPVAGAGVDGGRHQQTGLVVAA
jgi:hypothetical protein